MARCATQFPSRRVRYWIYFRHVYSAEPRATAKAVGSCVLLLASVSQRPAQPLPPAPPCHTDSGGTARSSPQPLLQRPPTTRPYRSFCAPALRRRVGSVADDALSAACTERSKASRPSAIGPSSSYVLWKTTDSSSDVPRLILQLYLGHPAKPLAVRRPKVPPATSYTFALFSIKNIH